MCVCQSRIVLCVQNSKKLLKNCERMCFFQKKIKKSSHFSKMLCKRDIFVMVMNDYVLLFKNEEEEEEKIVQS